MKRNDESETERLDARNSLEELIFEARDKIEGANDFNASKANTKKIILFFANIEKWLYNKGENCSRETYEKLHSEIENSNMMMEQIKLADDKFEVDFKSLSARVINIVQNSSHNIDN